MKTFKTFFYALMVFSVALASCNKDDDDNANPDNPNTGSGTMTATVNGNSFDATLAVQAVYENGVLSVAGNNGNAQQLQITLLNPDGTGTYQIGGNMANPNTGMYVDGPSAEETYTTMVGVGTGSVEITEFTDSKVKGFFSFTARNTAGDEVSVTNGQFDVNI